MGSVKFRLHNIGKCHYLGNRIKRKEKYINVTSCILSHLIKKMYTWSITQYFHNQQVKNQSMKRMSYIPNGKIKTCDFSSKV